MTPQSYSSQSTLQPPAGCSTPTRGSTLQNFGPQSPVVYTPSPSPPFPDAPFGEDARRAIRKHPPSYRARERLLSFAAKLMCLWPLQALAGIIRLGNPPREPHPEREPSERQRRRVHVARSLGPSAGMTVQYLARQEPPLCSPPVPSNQAALSGSLNDTA